MHRYCAIAATVLVLCTVGVVCWDPSSLLVAPITPTEQALHFFRQPAYEWSKLCLRHGEQYQQFLKRVPQLVPSFAPRERDLGCTATLLTDLDGARHTEEVLDGRPRLQLLIVSEGVQPEEGPQTVERWDPWFTQLHTGSWRMYYLKQRSRSSQFWWAGAHIATARSDGKFDNWKDEAFVRFEGFEPGEDTRMLAGCTVTEPNTGRVFLFYTNASSSSRVEQPLQLAVSDADDGVVFRPASGWDPIGPTHSGQTYYASAGDIVQWRDPFVLSDPRSGLVYLYLAAGFRSVGGWSFNVCVNGTAKPCIDDHPVQTKFSGAVAVAVCSGKQMDSTWQLLPPATGGIGIHRQDQLPGPFAGQSGFWEMERPKVVAVVLAGTTRYHLFFNAWLSKVNPLWVVQHLGGKPLSMLSGSSMYHYVSNSPEGPFVTSQTSPILPGSENCGLYGTSIVPVGDGIVRGGGTTVSHYIHGWRLKGDAPMIMKGPRRVRAKMGINETLTTGMSMQLVWSEDGEPSLVGGYDKSGQVCQTGCGNLSMIPHTVLELTRNVRVFTRWEASFRRYYIRNRKV